MTRFIPALVLLAACGGHAAPAPVATPRQTATAAPTVPTVQMAAEPVVKDQPQLWFKTATITFWGGIQQTSSPRSPMDPAFRPGSTVAVADVACRLERVTGKPDRATCGPRAPGAATDPAEKWYRDRFAACFRAKPAPLAASSLRALEAQLLPNHNEPIFPNTRPAAPATFVLVSIQAHDTEAVLTSPPVVQTGCENVRHPCDPVLVQRFPTPVAKPLTHVVDKSSFVAYGPHDYAFYGTMSSDMLFPQTGDTVLYAVPGMGDRLGRIDWDARFELPTSTMAYKEDLTDIYRRIAGLPLDGENESTQFALALDRAVLAWVAGDARAGKKHVADLGAWIEKHHPKLPDYAEKELPHTLATLAALARGDFVLSDPCMIAR